MVQWQQFSNGFKEQPYSSDIANDALYRDIEKAQTQIQLIFIEAIIAAEKK